MATDIRKCGCGKEYDPYSTKEQYQKWAFHKILCAEYANKNYEDWKKLEAQAGTGIIYKIIGWYMFNIHLRFKK